MTALASCWTAKFDEQAGQGGDLHAVEIAEGDPQECEAFCQSEQRLLLLVVRDGDDHFIEEFARPLDDIEVAVGDWIKAAGINRASHEGGNVQRPTFNVQR